MVYRGAWGFVGTLSWTTAAVYFIRDVDMTPFQLVLAGTALEIAYFLFEVPTGVVADTYSRKASLVVAALLSGIAMIGIGAVPEFGWVLAGMALWGFAWTFRSGAEDAWLADELGNDSLGAAYQRGAQVARTTGLLGIATAVGLALVDLRLPFLAAGGTTVVLGVYLMVRMPEHGFVRPERHPAHGAIRAATTTARTRVRLSSARPRSSCSSSASSCSRERSRRASTGSGRPSSSSRWACRSSACWGRSAGSGSSARRLC